MMLLSRLWTKGTFVSLENMLQDSSQHLHWVTACPLWNLIWNALIRSSIAHYKNTLQLYADAQPRGERWFFNSKGFLCWACMLFLFSSTTLHIHIVTHIHSWKFPNLASVLYYWLLCWNTSAVLHRGSSETRCSKMLLSFYFFQAVWVF